MKLSARNILSGTVVSVTKGATTAHVTVDIGGGQIITSAITNESVEALDLAPGKAAKVIVKSSDVIIGVD
jgi:molybdopterin-binding protein